MKREAIEELFAYTDYQWGRLARVIDDLPSEDFTKPVGRSGWPSLHRALLHVVGAYDGWINDDKWGLGLGKSPYQDVESWDELAGKLRTWEDMKAYRESARTSFQEALAVPDEELFARKTWDLELGPEELSRADILTNLLVHEIAHRGDISTLFHQLGLKHFHLDYRFFKSKLDQFVPDSD
jgi:uncharacterized damage-inducible protein DinB